MPTHLAWDAGILLLVLGALWLAGDYLMAVARFVGACLFGVACYLVIDYASAATGLSVGVNPVTVAVAGLLGVPGVALTVFARLLFGHP